MKRFDPFTYRLCRDIRNDLSEALMASLHRLDLTPVQKVADRYLAVDPEPVCRQYIDDRLQRYCRALGGYQPATPYRCLSQGPCPLGRGAVF